MTQFRTYRDNERFGEDYVAVRNFLLKLEDLYYPFGLWDWIVTYFSSDPVPLGNIGLWEDNGEIVAVAVIDCVIPGAILRALPGCHDLRAEMLDYASTVQKRDTVHKVVIDDGDEDFQTLAAERGFIPSQHRHHDSCFPIGKVSTAYTLPEGFRITSMAETYDLFQYGKVMWNGFDNELNGRGPYLHDEAKQAARAAQFERPNVNRELKIAVVSPSGDFASYCGMWFDPASKRALVEPMATDPAYRKLGLGRAAVLEGIRRCGELGATAAFVGSGKPFYYHVGFRPFHTSTWWEKPQPA